MRVAIYLVLSALFSGTVNAAPVTWYLQNAVFDDGGVATGSFRFDADTNTYSHMLVETTDGSVRDGSNYTGYIIHYSSDMDVLRVYEGPYCDPLEPACEPVTGLPVLVLGFDASLTNAGGQIGLGGGEVSCGDEDCDALVVPARSFTSGVVSSVPIPAAVWLFGSALAGLGWMRRKQAT